MLFDVNLDEGSGSASLGGDLEAVLFGGGDSDPQGASADHAPRQDGSRMPGGGSQGAPDAGPPPEDSPVSERGGPEQLAHPARKTAGLRAPVRPQLFPEGSGLKPAGAKRRGASRVSRASAVPPDPAIEAAGHAGSGDTDAILQAAVQAPRPVFSADLAELVGGSEAVTAWEERVRSTKSPIRFVASAGRRHQDLGSLVLPYPRIDSGVPVEFQRSLWGKLISSYRGGRLYELGVVVRRYGEDVVSSEVSPEVVTLRLSQKRGLVGMVLATATDLSPESSGAGALTDAVDALLAERLTAIVVLVLGADKLEPAIAVISTAARARNWRPLMPVIAACSYEYVKDEHGSSTLVLG